MTPIVRGFRRGVPLLVAAVFAVLAITFILRYDEATPGESDPVPNDLSLDLRGYGAPSYLRGTPQPLGAGERVYARSRDEEDRDRLLLFVADHPPDILLRTEPGQTIRQVDTPGKSTLLATLVDSDTGSELRVLSCDAGDTWVDVPATGIERDHICFDVAADHDEQAPTIPFATLAYIEARRGVVVDYVGPGDQPAVLSWIEGNRAFVSLLNGDGIPLRPWDIGRFRTVRVNAPVITGDWCPEPLAFAGGKLQSDPCRLIHFDTGIGEVRLVKLTGSDGVERGLRFTLLWVDE